MKVFFVYTLLLGLSTSITLYIANFDPSSPLLVLTVKAFVLFEFLVISFLFYNLISSNRFRKVILGSMFLFTLLYLLIEYNKSPGQYYNLGGVVSFLVLICFIFYFFYEKLRTLVQFPLYQTKSFWIAVGLFIYFSGNFFVIIFSQTDKDNVKFLIQLRIIYLIITLIKNIILSIALFVREPIIANNSEALDIPESLDLDQFDPVNFKNDRE